MADALSTPGDVVTAHANLLFGNGLGATADRRALLTRTIATRGHEAFQISSNLFPLSRFYTA